MAAKLIEKSGAWISYGDLRLGQGREKAIDFLRENPNISGEIEAKIRAASPASVVATPTDDAGEES